MTDQDRPPIWQPEQYGTQPGTDQHAGYGVSGQPSHGISTSKGAGQPYAGATPAPGALPRVTCGSPRWLQIVRDVLISLVAVLFIAGAVLTAVALNQAGNALSDIGTPDPSPTVCLIDPNDPSCIPGG